MKKVIIFFILLINILTLNAQSITDKKPKIVVQIVVEQMRYDFISRYWNKFGEHGFKKMINEGTFCHNVKYNYLITASASGYATIVTGSTPSLHGIVADTWYSQLKETEVTAVEDSKETTIGANLVTNIGKSPRNLDATTWTDELKLSNYKQSKVISIAINDNAAILTGGILADAAYWYDYEDGHWVSSSYYFKQVPNWVNQFNDKEISDLYVSQQWTTLLDENEYSESLLDANSYEVGFKSGNTFPYNITNLKELYGSYEILKYTPFGNTFTKDFAITAMIEEKLGNDEITDFIAIGFAATGSVNDIFGLRSIEIEDTYIRLDNDIAHLLSTLEDLYGKDNFLVYLTADRGATDDPLFLKAIDMKGGYFNLTSSLSLLNTYLKAFYGSGEWISFFYQNQIYLNHTLIEQSKISLSEIQDKVAEFMIQFTGISYAISANKLINNSTDGIFAKIQNSFYQKKSGDVFIVFSPGWMADPKITGEYSISAQISPFNNNLHVPLIFYGWKIPHKNIYRQIKIQDLAVTMAMLFNIAIPNAAQGEGITEILE